MTAKRPPFIVYIGIFLSALSLAVGFLIGISALAINNGYNISTSIASGILFHPDLMVFGAVGGLLITEKLELMEKFPLVKGIPISRPTVFFLFSGIFIASLGILFNSSPARFAGLVLIFAGSLLFLFYMSSRRNPGDIWIKRVFAAAIASMSLTAIGNINALIVYNVELTYLALLFPIIYVLAERMELGFVRGMRQGIIKVQVLIAWLAVILAFAAAEMHVTPYSQEAMFASISLVLALTLISVRYDPAFRKLRMRGRFQAFMRAGILISFFWLVLGLILFVLQLILGQGFLDPAAHSIALGFIGTFIFAHSPVIFPLTLKKNARQERVTFLPLLVLTVANAMRVFGDLAIPLTSVGFMMSYFSGYVLIIAIVAFVYNLRRIMVPDNAVAKGSRLLQGDNGK